MKKLVYTISILLVACSAIAQDLTDALRYSNYKINGTARSEAMGNAFGALGSDFTSLSINPAGIAVYRSGEFTFTPSFGKTSVDGAYMNNTSTDSKYNLGVNNIGYVTTIPTGSNSESGVVSFSFGLGFNRLGSFSMNTLARGDNAKSSLLGYFTDNANNPQMGISQYYEQLAIDANLLLYDNNNNEYYNDITDYWNTVDINKNYGPSVRKSNDRRGYINEYLISFGANFNHKFYLGGTVGIHDVYFKDNLNIYEWDDQNKISYFNDFNFNHYLRTTGSGFNLKIGAIYKPTENLRLGLAIHTPTFYKFNDEYDSSMKSSITYDDGVTENVPSYTPEAGIYDYEFETPMRAIFSGAYVIGKSGLISVDYEIVDYSTSKLKNGSDGYDYITDNQTIKDAFKTVGNLHIGGEYRVNKSFSLRAGYENFPSVYQTSYLDTTNPNGSSKYSTVSCGFGFRQGNFFMDAAVKQMTSENYQKFYPDPNATEMVKYSTNQNNVILTLGYKF